MKKSLFLTAATCLMCMSNSWADYTDVPFSLNNGQFTYDNYTFSTKTGYYQEWDHYVIFWSTGYGSQNNPTTIGSGNYLLNLSEMKNYAEQCYTTYTGLGFVDPTNLGSKSHKIIILAYYSTDWFATGSGYGDYGLLNISHSSANPSADYYTYCHEIAHAYQYLGYNLNGGNAGFQYGDMYGYVSYYECSANWQASQIYKEKHFPQIDPVYIKTTNLAFGNQWHCYQAYPMNDYFTEMRSKDCIGKIWTVNTNTKYADPVEKYMSLYNLTAEEVYKEFFWGAMRMATWDLDRWKTHLSAEGVSCTAHMDHTPGTKAARNYATTTPNTYNDNCWEHQSTYQYVTTNSSQAIHQVAYSSAPQSTGYNIIQLNVPSGSNRTVTTTFTALQSGCSLASGDNKEYWCGSMWATNSGITNYNSSQTSECNSNYSTYKNWRGFRLGYVTYNKSTGERKYNYTDKVFCTGTNESSVSIQFDVPENVDYLYLVVSPALSNYLRMGAQDPYNISSDAGYLSAQKERDQWPYRVQFYNTNIYGLSNPSTTFSGSAETGTTYTTDQLPDMGSGQGSSSGSSTTTETTATLTKTGAGSSSQTITLGDAITDFGYSWTEATGATVTGLPNGVTATVNTSTKTIAISGTPTETGTFSFTVETTGATTNASKGGKIVVNAVPVDTIEKKFNFDINLTLSSEYTPDTVNIEEVLDWLGVFNVNTLPSSLYSNGDLKEYGVEPNGSFNSNNTANEPGQWFDANGNVSSYDNGYIYSEFTLDEHIARIGHYPNKVNADENYSISQALVYGANKAILTYNISTKDTTSTGVDNVSATAQVAVVGNQLLLNSLTVGIKNVKIYNALGIQLYAEEFNEVEKTIDLSCLGKNKFAIVAIEGKNQPKMIVKVVR